MLPLISSQSISGLANLLEFTVSFMHVIFSLKIIFKEINELLVLYPSCILLLFIMFLKVSVTKKSAKYRWFSV